MHLESAEAMLIELKHVKKRLQAFQYATLWFYRASGLTCLEKMKMLMTLREGIRASRAPVKVNLT